MKIHIFPGKLIDWNVFLLNIFNLQCFIFNFNSAFFQILSEQYIQESDPYTGELVTYNNLTLHAVPRTDLHSNITCEASNYNNSIQQKTITLDMNFLPLRMEVNNKASRLLAGTKKTFTCKAYGSRPPAVITWWLDNKRVDGEIYAPAPVDGTTSTSTLTILPTEQDTNKTITCKAENREIRQGVLKESWTLNVLYPPRLTLELSSMLEEKDVAEGNDVFFVCKIASNPPISRMVEWYHNGKLLRQNQKKGIIMNSMGTNLVLQEVRKEANGNYTCGANNGIPSAAHMVHSKPFLLDVKYHPVCVPEGVKVYGVAKEENVRIRCQVAANPPNITFRWTFNNSAEIKHVSPDKFSSNGTVSLFSYKPERELDYGTLMCWSRNAIGEQQKPCVFHIIAAGKPDPVKNCSISNVTSNSFQISCSPGFNGGLPQNFTLEVVENEALKTPVFSEISDKPIFSVLNLKESTEYRVYIAPVNMKGVGQPQSPRGTEVRTNGEPKPLITNPEDSPQDQEEALNPVLVIILGGATGLVLILVTITLAVRVRCARRGNVSRDSSKVVVTTITDMEYPDDPNQSNLNGDHTNLETDSFTKPSFSDDSFPLSVPGDTESSYLKVQPPPPNYHHHKQQQQHQPPSYHQTNRQYMMYNQPDSGLPHSYCTMRKHNPLSVQFADHPAALEHGKDEVGLTDTDHQFDSDVIEFCEKQKAAFMYGTLRNNQANSDLRVQNFHGFPKFGAGGGGGEDPGCVVPPPPMFEEGNLNMKTPLIAKKCGKPEKKDKMESRV